MSKISRFLLSTALLAAVAAVGINLVGRHGLPHEHPEGVGAWLTAAGESARDDASAAVEAAVSRLAALRGVGEPEAACPEDVECRYADVEAMNAKVLKPVIDDLVKTAFFRFFKVNIFCDCPFWPDDSMCVLEACSVCECEEGEVPEVWRQDEACDLKPSVMESESSVDKHVDAAIERKLHNLPGWRGLDNPWMGDVPDDVEYQYINLLTNPERYTGYKGEHANRIWRAIYAQNCFSDIVANGIDDDTCQERVVFYRLMSGIHGSITAHIAEQYLLDEIGGSGFGANLDFFRQRLATPRGKTYVENIYFTYLFVLKATMRAAPFLEKVSYETGLADEDAKTAALMHRLLSSPELTGSCPLPFDEGRLWKGDDAPLLKSQLQGHFQNITRIMDCVGCEKCKLWGKLQTLGLATALKIMFSAEDCDGSQPTRAAPFSELQLERNEVIALVNLLARLSSSVNTYATFSESLMEIDPAHTRSIPPTDLIH